MIVEGLFTGLVKGERMNGERNFYQESFRQKLNADFDIMLPQRHHKTIPPDFVIFNR